MAKSNAVAEIVDGKVYILQAGTPIFVKTADMCAFTGNSNQWIGQLTSEGKLNKSATPFKAMYELGANLPGYIEMIKSRAPSKEEQDIDRAKAKAETTLKMLKAEKARMEVNELKGKMHRSDDVAAMTADLVFAVRSALMALPGRLAVSVTSANSPAEAAAAIKGEVDQILTELSNYQYDSSKYAERVRARTNISAEEDDDDDE